MPRTAYKRVVNMPWHSVDNTKTIPGDNTLMPSESVTDFGQKGREVEPNRTLSSTLQILDWKKQYGGGEVDFLLDFL